MNRAAIPAPTRPLTIDTSFIGDTPWRSAIGPRQVSRPDGSADGVSSVDHASLIREDSEFAPILEVLDGERIARGVCGNLHLETLWNADVPQFAQLGIPLQRGGGLRL